jgi:hypothetical protein
MTLMSENINEIMASLSKAQGQMSAAAKDSNNPFFNSKYADLNSVWNACRDALSSNGLAVVQTMITDTNGEMSLQTILGHSSGQWMKSILPIKLQVPKEPKIGKDGKPKEVNELQLLGSSLTYLRRYALAAIVGVAPDEDDDGNSGGQHYKTQQNKSYLKQQANSSVVPQPKQIITKQQADELLMILQDCEDQYQEWFINAIKRPPYNASSIYEIPIDRYNDMKKAIIKNREEYLSKSSEVQEESYAEKAQ